jgi:hypothetical protein
MPNWCNNTVEINHKDKAKMYALVAAINEGKFCSSVIPTPQELTDAVADFKVNEELVAKYGFSNWYDYQVAKWGTKWDVDAYEPVEYDDQHDEGITFGFDSAWSPPIGIYEALVEDGYEVRAYYYEPGMGFAGIWDNGDDDFYEISGMTADQAEEELPEALDDMFGISENMAQWEEENAEDEEENG